MVKTYKCTGCKKDNAYIKVDESSKEGKYGILGIQDLYDSHLSKGQVICNRCREVFYTYEDSRHKKDKKNETK